MKLKPVASVVYGKVVMVVPVEDLRAWAKEKYPIHETSTYHKGRKDIIKELLTELEEKELKGK